MTPIESLQAEIESLSATEFVQLRDWIVQRDWQLWDKQIESDSAAGKLDFLKREANDASVRGELRDL